MALTDEEQRLLAELEQTLSAEDPRLATKLAQPHRSVHGGKAIIGALGVMAGLAALVVGISVHWAISVVGFVVMLASVILLLSAWVPSASGDSSSSSSPTPRPTESATSSFMSKLEARWENRQNG